MRRRHCDMCNSEIVWVTVMPSGKRMPIDPGFDNKYGNLRREYHTSPEGKLFSTVTVLSGAELDEARSLAARYPTDPSRRLWVPHRATCSATKTRSR